MKKRNLFLLASLSFLLYRSKRKSAYKSLNFNSDLKNIWDDYDRYREATITNRFFKHQDLISILQKLAETKGFNQQIAGYSAQGRSIHHLTWGQGKKKVLLWSQMHGDESTATMALLDLFNILSGSDECDSFRRCLSQELELHFIPMLNPDGAEIWTRRNAMEMDINRDARDLVTPEGKILEELGRKIKPDFAFNLHDQLSQWAAGLTPNPATISFLAPAYNYQKDLNPVREKAVQLIITLNQALQPYIPNQIGRFNDDHDPRCFGDNFQKWGASTILIESGGRVGDPEKQYIRKLNFIAFLTAFVTIASENYQTNKLEEYAVIPENSKSLFDLVIRNVTLEKGNRIFTTNLGIQRHQCISQDLKQADFRGTIEEMSDMDFHFGYEELDATNLKATAGKVKEMPFADWDNLNLEAEYKLLQEGFLYIKWSDKTASTGPIYNHLLNVTNQLPAYLSPISLEKSANFLVNKNNEFKYAVINGFLINLSDPPKSLPNSWVE